MPNAASVNGTNSVRVTDANASENPVHIPRGRRSTTRGWPPTPARSSGRDRARAGTLTAPTAVRSQKPAPKSAPPKTAYATRATSRTQATAVLIARPPRSLTHRCPRSDRTACRGHEPAASPEAATHRTQDEDRRDAERDVEQHHSDEGDPDSGVRGRRVLDLHQVVDDPWLTSDLGDHPSGLERHHGQDAGPGSGSQEPPAGRHPSSEYPARAVPDRQQEQQRAQTDHHVPGQVDHVGLRDRRSVIDRDGVQALHDRRLPGARVGQPRREIGDRNAARRIVPS